MYFFPEHFEDLKRTSRGALNTLRAEPRNHGRDLLGVPKKPGRAMPNDSRKQQNKPTFLSKAAVGVVIGGIAAVGGYFFGKAVEAEEQEKLDNRHEEQRANTSSHRSQHTHVTDGDDVKKPDIFYEDARACGICFRDFEEVKRNDEAIHATPCGHVYCNECLQECLTTNPVCPSCRSTVLPTQTMRVYL